MSSEQLFDILMAIRNVGIAVISPDSYFWLVTLVVALQYYRMAQNKARFFRVPRDRIWPMVFLATGWGIVAGVIGSVLMAGLNLSISLAGLEYLWPLAILLMLINPRFLCFAYAGGILSLSHLLFGWPEINVSQLMALVGVLHLMESFLILVSGHLGAIPTYMKLSSGEIVGAFSLQRLWPIPLALLILSKPIPFELEFELIRREPFYPFYLVVAALGYSDIALSQTPKEKSRTSFVYLGIYSVILLTLSIFSDIYPPLVWIAVLFGPLGHELVIKLGLQREFGGRPIYRTHHRGVMVLDVVDKSPAALAGLRSGDIVLSVNGTLVDNKPFLEKTLQEAPGEVRLKIARKEAFQLTITLDTKAKTPVGIIWAPDKSEEYYMEILKDNWFMLLLRRGWRAVSAKAKFL